MTDSIQRKRKKEKKQVDEHMTWQIPNPKRNPDQWEVGMNESAFEERCCICLLPHAEVSVKNLKMNHTLAWQLLKTEFISPAISPPSKQAW